jgi:hypothetical protein
MNLLHEQLRQSLDDNCWPLAAQGARGALFKVRLATHGYTVAAKGTVRAFVSDLRHELRVYQRLGRLQGSCVPVCLGNLDLPVPYYLPERVVIVHMLFLSWAGKCVDQAEGSDQDANEATRWAGEVIRSVDAVHRAGVLHNDLRPAHLLKDPQTGRAIVIDFERATIRPRLAPPPPLSSSTKANQQPQRSLDGNSEQAADKRGVDALPLKKRQKYHDLLADWELMSARFSRGVPHHLLS